MKLFQEPIEVQAGQGEPQAFQWRGCVYRVTQVLGEWTWRGRWWTDADLGGERRHYFRVACEVTAQAAAGRTTPLGRPSARRQPRALPSPTPNACPAPRTAPPRGSTPGMATSRSEPIEGAACFDIFRQGEQWTLCRLLD